MESEYLIFQVKVRENNVYCDKKQDLQWEDE